MTPEQARGVEKLFHLLNTEMKTKPPAEARQLADGLTDTELADVFDALAAADLGTGGTGMLLLETAAARLRGVDVADVGSARALQAVG